MITLLTIPGLWSSGPDHWQTYWKRERKHTCRVEQENWETPRRADWIERIRAAIRNAPGPVVLAAHSLGCATVAHLAREATPSELPKYPPGTDGFVPMPLERLPFKATVVISSDDEWVSPERARQFASAWGAR